MIKIKLITARKKHLEQVLSLMKLNFTNHQIAIKPSTLMNICYPLLSKDDAFGAIHLIKFDNSVIGYIALCYSYSIRSGGRIGAIDDFFLLDEYRGKKIAISVLDECKNFASKQGLKALDIKIREENSKIEKVCLKSGFEKLGSLLTLPLA